MFEKVYPTIISFMLRLLVPGRRLIVDQIPPSLSYLPDLSLGIGIELYTEWWILVDIKLQL
jgi:hypothetical protein